MPSKSSNVLPTPPALPGLAFGIQPCCPISLSAWISASFVYVFTINVHLRLYYGRPPKIQQVFKSYTHSDVVAGPSKYANSVDNICPIPNDNVPEFVATPPKFFNERNMNSNTLILPPHIRDVDHTMGFGAKQRQETFIDISHDLSVAVKRHSAQITFILRVLFNFTKLFVVTIPSGFIFPYPIQQISIRRRCPDQAKRFGFD